MLPYSEKDLKAMTVKIFRLYLESIVRKDSSNLATFFSSEVMTIASCLHSENKKLHKDVTENGQVLSTILQDGIVNGGYNHNFMLTVMDLADNGNSIIFQEPEIYKNEQRSDIYQTFIVSPENNCLMLIEVYSTPR